MWGKKVLTSILLATTLYCSPVSAEVWQVKRQWNPLEVNKYSEWIENIYTKKKTGKIKQKGAKLDHILQDPDMNLFLKKGWAKGSNKQPDKKTLKYFTAASHCGSYPTLTQFYYSYMRGLPFIASVIRGKGGDLRYLKNAKPKYWVDNISFKGSLYSFLKASVMNPKGHFVSGNHRTSPLLEKTDSVPINIDKNYIKPGTIVYNSAGHVLQVGKIGKDGSVYFLDSHPDKSISYNKNESAIRRVANIKNINRCYGGFRSHRWATLKKDKLGRVIGVRSMTNKEMKKFGYGTKQYKEMQLINTKKSKYKNFIEYVRKTLKNSNIKEKPFEFIDEITSSLHGMFQTRKTFIKQAWANRKSAGPIPFPNNKPKENIYQAHGRWETWSSPSSDCDRKAMFIYAGKRLEAMINSYDTASNSIDLEGRKINSKHELTEMIIREYKQKMSEKFIEYSTHNGSKEKISMLDVENRLFDQSFNPNHPIPLRWGDKKYLNTAIFKKKFSNIKVPYNGFALTIKKSYEKEKGLRFNLEREEKPTKLDDPEHYKTAPEKRPIERLTEILNEENNKNQNNIFVFNATNKCIASKTKVIYKNNKVSNLINNLTINLAPNIGNKYSEISSYTTINDTKRIHPQKIEPIKIISSTMVINNPNHPVKTKKKERFRIFELSKPITYDNIFDYFIQDPTQKRLIK